MLRVIKWIVGLTGLAFLAIWLLLSASFLAGPRGDMLARFLSGKVGQEIKINGGARVGLGAVLQVSIEGLALPGQESAGADLVEIGQLSFDLGLADLLEGRVLPSGITANRTSITLSEDQDGAKSWSSAFAGPKTDSETKGPARVPAGQGNGAPSITDILAGEGIQFSDTTLKYRSSRNGLELDLVLETLNLNQQNPSDPLMLQGKGNLNGETLTLNGNFLASEPFGGSLEFDHLKLNVDGTPSAGGYGQGFTTKLTAKIAELGQLLDVLKLEKSVAGTGEVGAVLKVSENGAFVDDLNVQVDLTGGQRLSVKGSLGQLGDPSDVTLDTDIRLYADDNLPEPTTSRRELKLIGVWMQMVGQKGGVPQRRMVIETNGFKLDTSGEGPPPFAVSGISRTPEGFLRLGKMVLRIGPPAAPFVTLEGSVNDTLRIKGVEVKGILALPAASLLAPEHFQTSDVLGSVAGDFMLTGSFEKLSMTGLNAGTEGSDLWDLKVSGSVGNALKFGDVTLDVVADVPSGATLLEAMGLEPVDSGPVTLTSKLLSHGSEWNASLNVAVAESQLNISSQLDFDEPAPTVRGKIESDLIRAEHIRDITAAAVQLGRLDDLEKAAAEGNSPTDAAVNDDKVEETLVTKTPPETGSDIEEGYEPLVVNSGEADGAASADNGDANGQADTSQGGAIRNVTLQPLGKAVLLSGMDLDVTIDLRKIEGEKGTTRLTSDLEFKDQKARLGPLKFEYGDIHFDVGATIDLKEAPDVLNIKGTTGGWNLGEIMRDLRFKKSVTGTLYANADVSGHHTSVRDFLDTLEGNATVSMRNGSIDTQLLDVAGLGVIPWLFSKDKGKTASIVCLNAPLYMSNGRISSKQSVLETSQVQIVVYGNLDLRHKSIDIHGQPRRIGKPLARSPWPFSATGSLSKPKIKVKDGPRKLKRSDGASTMPKRRKLCVPDILQLR